MSLVKASSQDHVMTIKAYLSERNRHNGFKMSNLNSGILVYGMSGRSPDTVRSFSVNFCYRIIMISILLQENITSYRLWNIFCINSFISEVEI